jgi:predicted amidohydrolase YtcJ
LVRANSSSASGRIVYNGRPIKEGVMSRRSQPGVIGVLVVVALSVVRAQPAFAQGPGSASQPADLILSNGKIITVDERFTIAQAVAVKGDRVVAVGTNQEVGRLAGPATRRIDLRGRSVVPGLIDNHMHLLRFGTTWKYEVRWDGVETRKEALERLRARTANVKPDEWIYNLGGWAVEQFSDDSKPFTREELDRVAPNHPVFLQASYFEAYLNSRALQALGIDQNPTDPVSTRTRAGARRDALPRKASGAL